MKRDIQISLIRHGATLSNKEKRYLGQTDEALSKEGREELRYNRKKYPKADQVYSSPMLRCRETCEILYPKHEICTIDEFREMDFGDFEGKNYKDLKDDARYQAWIDSNGTIAFPNGEDRETFIRRSQKGFQRVWTQIYTNLEKEEKQIVRVACVVHGGTIMSLLSSYYGKDYYDYPCKNGEGYLCELTEKGQFRHISKLF